MENTDKGRTHCIKMGSDSLAKNMYPNCPRIYLPNLSAQAQKFWISMKKNASLGVRSPWSADEMSSEFFCPQEFFVKADRLSFCFAEMNKYLVVAEAE